MPNGTFVRRNLLVHTFTEEGIKEAAWDCGARAERRVSKQSFSGIFAEVRPNPREDGETNVKNTSKIYCWRSVMIHDSLCPLRLAPLASSSLLSSHHTCFPICFRCVKRAFVAASDLFVFKCAREKEDREISIVFCAAHYCAGLTAAVQTGPCAGCTT